MKLSFRGFVSPPHLAIYVLIVANALGFLLCVRATGKGEFPASILIEKGALTPSVLTSHEYWRLIAYGFLHANLLHLLMNMFSLVILGPHLERRVGTAYFLIIYICSIIGGGVATLFAHKAAFVTVGASGGLFGLLAALFGLWILGKSDLSPAFFAVNFALNLVFSTRSPAVDWAAHLGGFVTGIAAFGGLDAVEHINRFWLRCKFPEFAKVNLLLLFAGSVAIAYLFINPTDFKETVGPFSIFGTPVVAPKTIIMLTVLIAAAASIIKLFDVLLARRHGLAFAIAIFAIANGSLLALLVNQAIARAGGSCASEWVGPLAPIRAAQDMVCSYPQAIGVSLGAIMWVGTCLALSHDLKRGIKDADFVAATLVAERRRRSGL